MAGLDALNLSRRVTTILEQNGINDYDALVALNARELLALPRFGGRCLEEVGEALEGAGLALADDPYGSYVCARHGDASWDTNLSNLFLCEDCAAKWQAEAFADAPPVYEGAPVDGYCLNCNLKKADVRLRQWFLCGTCERVARSIGRSVVAERFVTDLWEELIVPHVSGFVLENTDVPTLRRRQRNASATKRAEIDFVARASDRADDFGFELKTGKSHISGAAAVGAKMGQFQLDTSDCDDITAVMERENMPVYLLHVQVIDRAHPPTVRYVGLAGWWTDVFTMSENFQQVQRRPRETRNAAYYDTAMFRDFSTLADHLTSGGHERLAQRLRENGTPPLYQLPE